MADNIDITLNPTEKKMLLMIVLDENVKIEPHWDKIAEGTGLKNKKSARDTWYQFKKKLEKASGKPIGSPSTPKKRKAGETEGEGTDSPSKEKTARKLRKDKQVEDDGAAAAQAEDGVKQEEDGN